MNLLLYNIFEMVYFCSDLDCSVCAENRKIYFDKQSYGYDQLAKLAIRSITSDDELEFRLKYQTIICCDGICAIKNSTRVVISNIDKNLTPDDIAVIEKSFAVVFFSSGLLCAISYPGRRFKRTIYAYDVNSDIPELIHSEEYDSKAVTSHGIIVYNGVLFDSMLIKFDGHKFTYESIPEHIRKDITDDDMILIRYGVSMFWGYVEAIADGVVLARNKKVYFTIDISCMNTTKPTNGILIKDPMIVTKTMPKHLHFSD